MKILNISPKNYEFQWGERHSMLSSEFWAHQYGPYAFGHPKHIDFLVISEDKYLNTYASRSMVKEWATLSKLLLNHKDRIRLLRESAISRNKYWRLFHKFQRTDLTKATNKHLYQILLNYAETQKAFSKYFTISQPEGLHALTNILISKLKKKHSLHFLEKLITPIELDITKQEEIDLAKLKKIGRKKNRLLKHAYKYAWLFFNSYNTEENLRYLKNRLNNKPDILAKLKEKDQLQKEQKKLLREINDQEIEKICKFLQKISIERFKLKDGWGGAEFRFLTLFQQIANRLRLNLAPMMASYTLKDYETALLSGKLLSKQAMQERQKHYILWKTGSRITLLENGDAAKIIMQFRKTALKTQNSREIYGTPASQGLARGRVRIVKSVDIHEVLKDLKRFRNGDILVTWMTQPNMVPLARKAGAIVANEGGLTSHAAVIARELKIPCVVGTKIATQVFKDGDLVEVDANSGIVKKL